MLEGSYQLGLSDLLDQNLSCYEYFHSLPENVQRRIVPPFIRADYRK